MSTHEAPVRTREAPVADRTAAHGDAPPVEHLVDAVIEDYFADRIARAEALGEQASLLWRRAAASARGGKRLRPRLVVLAHDALGGHDRASAAVVAAAFEVLHSALLLHDDVLDGDLMRRGRANLAGEFAGSATEAGADPVTATAWGAASGLLAGDLLLSGVHALIARIDSPARAQLNEIVDDAVFLTAAGEHSDVGYALGVLPAESADIRRMMEQKTATYSFAAPLRAGAVLAGADAATAEALWRIGTSLGVLYQLRDDMLGVFGAEERTGKSTTGDLREGKRTLLIAFAEREDVWRDVAHLFGVRSLAAEDAERLRAALVTSGAVAAVEALIAEQRSQVERDIDGAGLPEDLRRELRGIAGMCVERDA
ncbi:polyprenyl synthetase family protein [Microbacterium sp. JZ31]|uniref:polyprenyl synthetase family protein n=1 Tax=Microbacterium sp. JZ31 TaxID=1906274 RepID=UPI0019336D01|nr:polyprenyl synthetase family protein [Microbacterium sp. JZ31]